MSPFCWNGDGDDGERGGNVVGSAGKLGERRLERWIDRGKVPPGESVEGMEESVDCDRNGFSCRWI